MSRTLRNSDLRVAVAVAALVLAAGPARPEGFGTPNQTTQADPGAQDVFAQRGGGRGGGAQGGQGRGGGRGQQRDTQNQPIGTGTIRGAIYSDTSGTPVRRAQVRLTGAALRGGRSVTTDDQGLYEFVALPAGRYTLTASKQGYVNNAYGARSPGRPGTPVQLAEGQTLEKAYISLPRGGVITGIVVDDIGDPSPGTQVRVMRFVIQSGERSVQQAGLDQTDDRGMYRVYGLQPGEYLVTAIPRNQNLGDLRQAVMSEVEALLSSAGGGGGVGRIGGAATTGGSQQLIARAAELQQQLEAQDQQESVAYAPVYYPGTASPAGASSVAIGIAEERSGVDFHLQLVQTASVEGVVMTYDGTLPQGTQVSLVPTDTGGLPSLPGLRANSSRVDQNGQFAFHNVTPGQYSLQARAVVRQTDPNETEAAQGRGGRGGRGGFGGRGGAIAQVLWAAADVNVSGTNLTNMNLSLQPGMTVAGRLEFDGMSAAPPEDLTQVRVSLTPRGQSGFELGGVPPAQVDENGNFTINGVAPGYYAVQANVGGRGGRGGGVAAASGQWALSSTRVGGVEALDFPFEVAPNQDVTGAVLTFSDRTQQLTGTIQDSSGRPITDFTIVVYPPDQRYWLPQSRRIDAARPDTDGRFSFSGLPPGEYRLTAIVDAEPGEWYNPSFLSQLMASGGSMSVSLAEGESKMQTIQVGGGF